MYSDVSFRLLHIERFRFLTYISSTCLYYIIYNGTKENTIYNFDQTEVSLSHLLMILINLRSIHSFTIMERGNDLTCGVINNNHHFHFAL